MLTFSMRSTSTEAITPPPQLQRKQHFFLCFFAKFSNLRHRYCEARRLSLDPSSAPRQIESALALSASALRLAGRTSLAVPAAVAASESHSNVLIR